MHAMMTDIIFVYTRNSTYVVKVMEEPWRNGVAVFCQKKGGPVKRSTATDRSFLDRLVIGASFDVPGVVKTSNVRDYEHFVLSKEEKRTTMSGFFGNLADELVRHVKDQAD